MTLPDHVGYTTLTAQWGSVSATAPAGFGTLGLTRFSQYNIPTESLCGTGTTPAFIFRTDGTCNYTRTDLKPFFETQTIINGTGKSVVSYIVNSETPTNKSNFLKPWRATRLNISGQFQCDVPEGANQSPQGNIFVAVGAATGTCNTLLSDGLSIAVSPNPREDISWSCSDQVLLIDNGNSSVGRKYVQDACPICYEHKPGESSHIDTFTFSEACTGHSILDLPGSPYRGIRLR